MAWPPSLSWSQDGCSSPGHHITVFKGKQQGRTQGNSFSTTFQRTPHSLHHSLQLIGGIQSHPIPRPRARAPFQRSQHLPSRSQSSPAPTAETPPCIQASLEALSSPQAVLRGRMSSKPATCCSWAPTRPVPERRDQGLLPTHLTAGFLGGETAHHAFPSTLRLQRDSLPSVLQVYLLTSLYKMPKNHFKHLLLPLIFQLTSAFRAKNNLCPGHCCSVSASVGQQAKLLSLIPVVEELPAKGETTYHSGHGSVAGQLGRGGAGCM